MAYRFAAYSLPHLAVSPHVALADQLPVQDWSFEDQRQRSRATIDLAVPSSQVTLLNSIFFVNPDDHSQDIGSIVHVYRDGVVDSAGDPAPVLSFLLGRRPDGMEDITTELTELQGSHILSLFDFAYLRAWDYPTFPSAEIDWMYDADSILDNGGFEDGTIGNEIQSIWIDEDVTAGTWSATFRGDLAGGIAFDVNTGDLETALDAAFTTMIDISVSGSGTEDSPWLVEFQDPGGMNEPQMTVSGAGLTGGTVHVDTVQNGGEPSLNNWTKSTLLTTGQLHGTYASDGFALSDTHSHSGTYSLRINGLTQFAGAQQIVEVIPGMRYRASIWMYTESAVDTFRLVIRDRFEALIAHSTPFEDTGTPFAWKEFTCEFVAPSWTNLLVFRFAYVGTGNPIPFWIDDAALAPGGAAATIGAIWLEMLADIQVDHAANPRGAVLGYVIPTFDAVNDSGGTPWPGVHKMTLNEGNSYLQIMEHHQENYGYEFDLRYDQDDGEFYFDIFVPGGLGTSHPTIFPAIVVGGGVTGGEAVRSAPLANSVFVRGSAGVWYEAQYSSTDAWGIRETHVAAKDAHSWEDLRHIGQNELDKHELAMIGLQFKVADNAQSIPMLHFKAGDYLTVTPGSDTAIPSGARRVETIKVTGHGGQVTDIDVHVQNEVYGSLGLAAQAEAIRRLMRLIRFTEPATGGAATIGLGGGGIPDVVIGASDTTFLDTANLVCTGDNDVTIINEARDLLGPGGGWIHFLQGTYFIDATLLFDLALGEDLRITGAGMNLTVLIAVAGAALGAAFLFLDGAGSNRITASDFTIDGNKANGATATTLVQFAGASEIASHFTNVIVTNGSNDGIYINRSAGIHHFTNVFSTNNNGEGMHEYECDSYHTNCHYTGNGGFGSIGNFGGQRAFIRCKVTGNGNDGIANSSLTGGGSYTVMGCQVDDNAGDGVNLNLDSSNDSPVIVVANFVRGNTGQSIITDSNAVVGMNFIENNGTDIPSTGVGTNVIGGVQPVPDLPQSMVFSYGGDLLIGTGTFKWVPNRVGRIVSVRAAVGTAPTGDDIVVDVNLNGASIFTNPADQPEIPATSEIGAAVAPTAITSFVAGDSFTVDIDQIGTTIPGADLTVMVEIVIDDLLDS